MTLQDNIIELATAATSLSGGIWQTGIRLSTGQTSTRFNQAAIRKNLIRDVQAPIGATAGLHGLDLQQIAQEIAENNIIGNIAEYDVGTSIAAVATQNCASRKFFNNEDPGGKLLRGYNGSQRQLELQDAVDDVLLPL